MKMSGASRSGWRLDFRFVGDVVIIRRFAAVRWTHKPGEVNAYGAGTVLV